jgi:GNAT superfamily N-acetyltransferase
MYWRLPRAEYDRNRGEGNKKALHELAARGEPLGVLAYDGEKPAGWCAVAPREAYPGLDRARTLKRLDAEPVWSVTCLFVEKQYRRQGLSVELVRAAAKMARAHGGRVVEAYPRIVRKESPAPFIWTGTLSTYTKAGFVECAAPTDTRRIVRLQAAG